MPTTDPPIAPLAPQVCQRCRATFPGDPTLLPTAIIEWWVCDGCRTALFGAPATAGGAR